MMSVEFSVGTLVIASIAPYPEGASKKDVSYDWYVPSQPKNVPSRAMIVLGIAPDSYGLGLTITTTIGIVYLAQVSSRVQVVCPLEHSWGHVERLPMESTSSFLGDTRTTLEAV